VQRTRNYPDGQKITKHECRSGLPTNHTNTRERFKFSVSQITDLSSCPIREIRAIRGYFLSSGTSGNWRKWTRMASLEKGSLNRRSVKWLQKNGALQTTDDTDYTDIRKMTITMQCPCKRIRMSHLADHQFRCPDP